MDRIAAFTADAAEYAQKDGALCAAKIVLFGLTVADAQAQRPSHM